MLFTVGLIDKYEPQINAGNAFKLGPHYSAQGQYQSGGWVWRTAEDARAFLKSKAGAGGELRRVYAVLAEWEIDTVVVPGQPTRCLTRDALVFRLPPEQG
jgi:hypothetical protein